MTIDKMQIVHLGRGGHLMYRGSKYTIDHVGGGCFSIHFPSGNKHGELQVHLDVLMRFAESKDPKWFVENSSRNYKDL